MQDRLLGALAECLLLAGLGLGLALMFGQPLLLLLLPVAFVLAIWRLVRWATFSIRIEGRQVTLHTLNGFVVDERVVSLGAPGGLRLHQNLSGWMFDYGRLRIEVFGPPVQIGYITPPFSALKRQIDSI